MVNLCIGMAFLAATTATPAPAPDNPFSAAARNYAEALLSHGRDRYGVVETPLFCQILDLRTLEIPKQRSAAEWRAEMASWREDSNYMMWGKDRSSVAWAQDSNLLWDTENVRLFYALSQETGDDRFAKAADGYLSYFLEHCVSPTTGLFAWGEHIAYNVVDDKVIGQRHELQHDDPPWPELWKFNPRLVQREIEGIYRYHVTDKESMAYDRHANYWNGLPERDQATIMLYVSVYVPSLVYLSAQTADARYEDWARRMVLAFQSKSNAAGLYPDNWTDRYLREQPLQFPPRPGLATAFYRAYEITHDPRWLDDANRYLEACLGAAPSAPSSKREDIETWMALGRAAAKGASLTGRADYLVGAQTMCDRIIGAGIPHAQMASAMAQQLNLFLDMYEATRAKRWLDESEAAGRYALTAFVHSSGLIRGTAIVDRPDYYDAIQGSGALALTLHRLGAMVASPLPVVPTKACEDARPLKVDISVTGPDEASNREAVTITAHIESPQPIAKAVLHYAYGTHVGLEDAAPTGKGKDYTFHIPAPGIGFLGEAPYAVEVFTGGDATARAMSPWRRTQFVTEDTAKTTNGTLELQAAGMRLQTAAQDATATVCVTNTLPEKVAAPEQGRVAVGRYFQLSVSAPVKQVRVSYTEEDLCRSIENTLALAYWDGKAWVVAPSTMDAKRKTVNAAPGEGAATGKAWWTVIGTDRVLWRAPGRETGPALVDLDGDGRREVVTTIFQNGQVLSSDGAAVQDYPVDPPYHPANNTCSPAVVTPGAGGAPLLVWGAPSGFVYAYTADGKRVWRTEVGGEVFGGVAAGKLRGEGDPVIVVSWEGGVAALDLSGGILWRTDAPIPARTTPALIDLDGDGLLDVVENAEGKVMAWRGTDGALLWEYEIPGRRLTPPAAGELVRGGKPRIAVGDDSGVLHVIDEAGRLLWRQDKLHGVREVPEPVENYAAIVDVGLADLDGDGEREVIASLRSGDTACLNARGERRWWFTSQERYTGTSLNCGARLAFADLDGNGTTEVILSQQDSYLYVLDHEGRQVWRFRGGFWYHFAPAIADLRNDGELDIVFTCPEEGGTYALRAGVKGAPGRAPWPMMRGGLERANCAAW